jgi:hypothetical protein
MPAMIPRDNPVVIGTNKGRFGVKLPKCGQNRPPLPYAFARLGLLALRQKTLGSLKRSREVVVDDGGEYSIVLGRIPRALP